MKMSGESKLSRVQLVSIVCLFLVVLIFGISFISEDKSVNERSANDVVSKHEPEASPDSSMAIQSTYFPEALTPQTQKKPNLNTQQEHDSSSLSTTSSKSFSSLDDESFLIVNDVLENSLVPAFLLSGEHPEALSEQEAAIEVFISRLPEGLESSSFEQINLLLRDYVPYDIADSVAQQIEQRYHVKAQESAYLTGVISGNSIESMTENIAIAQHLDSLQVQNKSEGNEAARALSQSSSDWQQLDDKLSKIKATSSDPIQDVHDAISDEYGSQAADDYFELSVIESEWQEKYAAFQLERNIISASGLSEDDKAEQIEALIQQHYNESEWVAARGYDAMMQAQPES